MGFFDKLFGIQNPPAQSTPQPLSNRNDAFAQSNHRWANDPQGAGSTASLSDQQAVARYRYMLQTAPPEAIEQAHQEAFVRLTPEQRRLVLEQMAANTPDNERSALSDDPRSLARAATRAEMRQPGTMERLFGGGYGGGAGYGGGMGGMGMGGMMMGGILTSIAGGFIGSAIANSFFNTPAIAQDYAGSAFAQDAGDTNFAADSGFNSPDPVDPYGDPDAAAAADPYGDPDASGGFDAGDAGGFDDFGGGDFGGGDFGGDF